MFTISDIYRGIHSNYFFSPQNAKMESARFVSGWHGRKNIIQYMNMSWRCQEVKTGKVFGIFLMRKLGFQSASVNWKPMKNNLKRGPGGNFSTWRETTRISHLVGCVGAGGRGGGGRGARRRPWWSPRHAWSTPRPPRPDDASGGAAPRGGPPSRGCAACGPETPKSTACVFIGMADARRLGKKGPRLHRIISACTLLVSPSAPHSRVPEMHMTRGHLSRSIAAKAPTILRHWEGGLQYPCHYWKRITLDYRYRMQYS